MNEIQKTKSRWRIARRIVLSLAIFVTLIAIFYAEEDWRGKRAWENCKRELEAKGEVLDWNAYIPPPVSDDQNFFAAPKMQEWFIGRNPIIATNEFYPLSTNTTRTAEITNNEVAKNFLVWSDQFEPDFNLIREALKRPYARIDGDYSIPYKIPIPNFVVVRIVAQTLAQRAKCDLLLGQPDKALQELTLLHDMCRLLLAAPTHKPMTLVAAMINVAVNGLYVGTIADGFQKHAWQEPQLVVLQEQLQKNNMAPFVFAAFKDEQAVTVYLGEESDFKKLMTGELFGYGHGRTFMQKVKAHVYDLMPQGWAFQNLVIATQVHQRVIDTFDLAEKQVFPEQLDAAYREVTNKLEHHSVFHLLADIAIPNYSKAIQTFAHNQTLINEAQTVCALERYHLARGNYPETLNALAPQFMETIPHDLIGGQPLHYRRTNDGRFALYSVGWNETDDGGVKLDSGNPSNKGDWVWQ